MIELQCIGLGVKIMDIFISVHEPIFFYTILIRFV